MIIILKQPLRSVTPAEKMDLGRQKFFALLLCLEQHNVKNVEKKNNRNLGRMLEI